MPASAIRAAIRELLEDYAKRPFFDLREADPQARLLDGVRKRVSPGTVLANIELEKGATHVHTGPVETSRVHLDLKVAGSNLRTDLAVFRAGPPVSLKCYPSGPADVVASVRATELCAAVEVKASPSKSQWATYSDDLRKLGDLRRINPEIQAFFVLFDKSIAVHPTFRSTAAPRMDWLALAPSTGAVDVEAWWLDDTWRVQSRVVLA